MSASLIPITSDGGFISGGNISFSNSTGSVFSTSSVNVQVGTDVLNPYWAEAYGDFALDTNESPATAVIYDSTGCIITTVTADAGVETQGMIRKLDSTGTLIWSYSIPTGLSGVDYSTAESIATDSTGTIYLLTNLWGTPNNILVSKLDSSGNLVWNNRISGLNDLSFDITCIADGRSFVVGNNNILTGLDANGAVSFSYTGAASYTVIDSGSGLLVSGANGYIRGFDYAGTALWENQVFAGGTDVYGVAWDGTDWYALDDGGYITKVSGSDNQTVIWGKCFTGVAGLFPLWIEYQNNYLYMAAGSNDGTVVCKISTAGNIVWSRRITLDSWGLDQWYWYGHRDLTVRNNLITICGYGGPSTANVSSKSIIITIGTDGNPVDTYSYYTIADLPELILDNLSNPGTGYAATPSYTTSTITENYDPISLVSPPAYTSELTSFNFIAPSWNFNLDGTLDLPSNNPEIVAQSQVTLTVNTSSWVFGKTGSLTFPDSTSISSAPSWDNLLNKTDTQGPVNVIVGRNAADNIGDRTDIVAIGRQAGGSSTYPAGTGTVSIGAFSAFYGGSGEYSVSIGYQAAATGSANRAVAIGNNAAYIGSGASSIAIGNNSGNSVYGPIADNAISIGASSFASSTSSVAIGRAAEVRSNAVGSIAIGSGARVDENHNNSIVLYAGNHFIYSAGTGTTVIFPIRNATGTRGLLQYNNLNEVTYSDQIPAATSESTASSVGYLGMPQYSTSTSYTLVTGDQGKHIYVTATGQTITIPSYNNINFPIGTTITIIAGPSATTVSIAITTDTMYLSGTGTTGTRTLAAYGMATAVKVAQSTWFISGTGLT